MKVKFKVTYFSSTDAHESYGRVMSGKRYTKGTVHELTDTEYEKAKKDGARFTVISGELPKEPEPVQMTLKEVDHERHAQDQVEQVRIEAEKTDEENKVKRGRGRPRKS